MNKQRKILNLATCGILSLAIMSSPVVAAENIKLQVNGISIHFSVEPMLVDGSTLVSLREMSNMIGAKYVWDVTTKTAIVTKGSTKLKVTIGQQVAYINGEETPLVTPAVLVNDSVMVPVRFIGTSLGVKVDWDDKTGTIIMDTGIKRFTVLDVGYLESENAQKITYENALYRANQMNSTLNKLEEGITEMEETYRQLENSLHYNQLSTTEMNAYVSTLRNLRELQSSINTVALDEKILRESTEYTLRAYITNIEKLKMDIKLADESVILAETNIKNMELKNSLGLVSDLDLKSAKLSLEQNKSQVSQAKISLKNTQQVLSRFLKFSMNEEVLIEFEPKIVPLNIQVEQYAGEKITESPTIKKLEYALSNAEYGVDTGEPQMQNATMDQIRTSNAYKDAQRNLNDAKLDMEKSIHSAYNQLQQLQDGRNSLTLELEKAKDTYNKTVINYQAGNVTLYDVDRARVGILDAEIALEKNLYDYDLLIFTLERPYLLSGK